MYINIFCNISSFFKVCQRIQDPVNHIFGRRQESFSFKGGCCTGDNCNRDIASTTTLSTIQPTQPTTTSSTTHEVQHLTTQCKTFSQMYISCSLKNYEINMKVTLKKCIVCRGDFLLLFRKLDQKYQTSILICFVDREKY